MNESQGNAEFWEYQRKVLSMLGKVLVGVGGGLTDTFL